MAIKLANVEIPSTESVQTALDAKLDKSGGTMTGPLTINGGSSDPSKQPSIFAKGSIISDNGSGLILTVNGSCPVLTHQLNTFIYFDDTQDVELCRLSFYGGQNGYALTTGLAVDNLTGTIPSGSSSQFTESNLPLSAKQGRLLNETKSSVSVATATGSTVAKTITVDGTTYEIGGAVPEDCITFTKGDGVVLTPFTSGATSQKMDKDESFTVAASSGYVISHIDIVGQGSEAKFGSSSGGHASPDYHTVLSDSLEGTSTLYSSLDCSTTVSSCLIRVTIAKASTPGTERTITYRFEVV